MRSPLLQTLVGLPQDFLSTYEAVSSLPPYDPSSASHLSMPLAEPGKRPWETSKTGYINWAVSQAIARVREKGEEKDNTEGTDNLIVENIVNTTSKIAKVDDVKTTIQLIEANTSHNPSRGENTTESA